MTKGYSFDWSDLAFGSKKEIDALKAIFIAAPREVSPARFKQFLKTYLPKGNIVLGIAKESFVLGLEEQPQFRMLEVQTVQKVIDQVNASSPRKVYTLSYFQREAKYIYEKLRFQKVVLVNGSWKFAFHTQESYYMLANQQIAYDMVSPFADEIEAREYEKKVTKELAPLIPKKSDRKYSEVEMNALAAQVALLSFDHTFQTGAVIGKKKGGTYRLLVWAYNKVVPYQTYAMHYGASREKHFSPPNDLNHYDTNHAEVEAVLKAGQEGIDLTGATLFVNLMPCPTCARMLSQTKIAEVVYVLDHSDGYASKLFEEAGKKVRRVV